MLQQSIGASKQSDPEGPRCCMITFSDVSRWCAITIEIGDRKLQALLDNGSEFSTISVDVYDKLLKHYGYQKSRARDGVDANMNPVKVLFSIKIPVVINDAVVCIPFRVLANAPTNVFIGNNVFDPSDKLGSKQLLCIPTGDGNVIEAPIFKWKRENEQIPDRK